MNDIDEYVKWTNETAIYPDAGNRTPFEITYLTLGLVGESGEVAEKLKKRIRDGTHDEEKLKKELGDVAWYWARLCKAHGFRPSEVLKLNIEKLSNRKERGKLKGSGDER